ncbi:MAG TPA: HAMP domain-containing sensor histidine kinase [Ramlibacter sp.]|nr:HAMP domain-containing sensor histidine kinase [Ramlibacter sp.]
MRRRDAGAELAARLDAALAQLDAERTLRAQAERACVTQDEFLSLVSHELRGPLGAILGWAHILRRRVSPEDMDKGLDVIEQSVQAQVRLVEDLLTLGRITSGRIQLEMQDVEPRRFIDAGVEGVRAAAQAKRTAVRKVLDLTVGPVRGDAGRLQQVVGILLGNAVKFTPEGGAIEVALRQAGTWAEIAVTDTGVGIAPALLPYVFERYRAPDTALERRYGGLGLGLAIARHLAEMQGGRLTAESPGEGRGATFRLCLPLAHTGSTPDVH